MNNSIRWFGVLLIFVLICAVVILGINKSINGATEIGAIILLIIGGAAFGFRPPQNKK